MALPSKEELILLETLRAKVADILSEEQIKDDMFLVRWLRARDLNVDKAADMLQVAMKWRKNLKLDEKNAIRKEIDPFFFENFPWWIDGLDKKGRPVYTCPIGKWDVRNVVREGKSPEFISYLTECFEKVMRAIKKSNELQPPGPDEAPITQIMCIFDWEGFAWGQLLSFQSVQNFLHLGSIYEAYYPEIVWKIYFTNCPALISTVLKLLKPILAPKTMDKITCIGTDKEGVKKAILEHIPPEQIRPTFGGTKMNDYDPFS